MEWAARTTYGNFLMESSLRGDDLRLSPRLFDLTPQLDLRRMRHLKKWLPERSEYMRDMAAVHLIQCAFGRTEKEPSQSLMRTVVEIIEGVRHFS